MTKPTLAFIGTGTMGQLAHLANYARLRDAGECEIAGVVDLKRGLAQAVAEKYGVQHVYADVADLLADQQVDGVVCIQQWPNNYALVRQVLEAGKSVLTEKPMVGRADEAQELVALAHEQGVLYAVGFMKRYDAGVELAKRLVDGFRATEELGPLQAVDALCNGGDWLHNVEHAVSVKDPTPVPQPTPTYPDACDTAAKRAAYDYLVNIFSHNINLCHHLLGTQIDPHYALFRGDRGMNSVSTDGDVLVTVRGTSSGAHEWRERTTLTFAMGELVIETPTPMNRQRSAEVSVLRKSADGWTTMRYHPPVGWAFYRQAQGFVRSLADGEPLRAPAETALWDVAVMQRLIEIAEYV
jgi:predicted dehydrogenase